MSFSDLWTEASRDLVAENQVKTLEMAKHASQGVWAFLAQAQDPVEYADRLDLVQANIEAVASSTGASLEDLLAVFDQRFSLLMEAKDNPFADDDKDDDDTDEDGDGSTDDDGKDSDKGDETDSDEDNDDSDDSDTDEDGKTDHDKDPDDDGDDDDVDDDGSDGTPPFPPRSQDDSAQRFASLMARIESGENPLNWGGRPFVHSSVRHTALGADDQVSDANVPNPSAPADGLGGLGPSLPESTKPRQLPGGGGDMGDSITGGGEPLDPALNGGDIGAGEDTPPDADSQHEAKVQAIASEVKHYNPGLSPAQCRRVALQTVARYFKQAEDISPLLYGDRGASPDGPLTQKLKSFEPSAPNLPGGVGGSPSGGSGGGGGSPAAEDGAAGAGEAAEGAGGLAEGAEALAPLLAL